MKNTRIVSHLEEAFDDLDEEHLDDLLAIAQQYPMIAMELQKIRMDQ